MYSHCCPFFTNGKFTPNMLIPVCVCVCVYINVKKAEAHHYSIVLNFNNS
jgi:hypothetical protein